MTLPTIDQAYQAGYEKGLEMLDNVLLELKSLCLDIDKAEVRSSVLLVLVRETLLFDIIDKYSKVDTPNENLNDRIKMEVQGE